MVIANGFDFRWGRQLFYTFQVLDTVEAFQYYSYQRLIISGVDMKGKTINFQANNFMLQNILLKLDDNEK